MRLRLAKLAAVVVNRLFVQQFVKRATETRLSRLGSARPGSAASTVINPSQCLMLIDKFQADLASKVTHSFAAISNIDNWMRERKD